MSGGFQNIGLGESNEQSEYLSSSSQSLEGSVQNVAVEVIKTLKPWRNVSLHAMEGFKASGAAVPKTDCERCSQF